MQKVAADILNALKTVVEVSVAVALHVDTTIGKTNSSVLLMPFLCENLFFLGIDLTITMTWVLKSPNTNVRYL